MHDGSFDSAPDLLLNLLIPSQSIICVWSTSAGALSQVLWGSDSAKLEFPSAHDGVSIRTCLHSGRLDSVLETLAQCSGRRFMP